MEKAGAHLKGGAKRVHLQIPRPPQETPRPAWGPPGRPPIRGGPLGQRLLQHGHGQRALGRRSGGQLLRGGGPSVLRAPSSSSPAAPPERRPLPGFGSRFPAPPLPARPGSEGRRLPPGRPQAAAARPRARRPVQRRPRLDFPQGGSLRGPPGRGAGRHAARREVVGIISDPRCNMKNIRICGILGDQQASLVAQTWDLSSGVSFEPIVKVTYGTGAFMLWDIGETPFFSDRGILTTVAFQMGPKKKAHYAFEGSVSFAGATIDWLKKKLKIFSDYDEAETLAQKAYRKHKEAMADPCYLVPAFSGLLCPWWQETARGAISGLTADVDCGDLIYAALRSAVYQTHDVLSVVTLSQGDSKSDAALLRPREIVADGGLTSSSVLLQSLADILDMIVRKHNHSEMMTALGAAVAAALAVGIEPSGLLKLRNYSNSAQQPVHTFASSISVRCRQVMLTGWHAAVERSLGWIEASSVMENMDSLQNLMGKTVKRKSDTPRPIEFPAPVEFNSEPKRSELSLSVGKFLSMMGLCVIFGAVLNRLINTK